ncbi:MULTISPECIES: poly-beta-1,6-N-acetyl-D-glucosamine N-deacetylase PgaB [Sporomusa]|uniref:poly-beta-1,6-N-acetyl-D-glucosamine N-deacetylase PgaB n=1 Tax=Sporomusa TaxID=2375 RepID=UPI00202DDE98|nr:poly-beta-1,6-N-acetyl-D-glucosamine N-deacetylase PgaB [Sporomusa sphaeroides]MCM0758359.1 poly-beta-1,6-N-acetyl-D-glucosamine N-deacetylase PgaB [Sporomusa sphaeroides DSM 2875]HML34857.1 poly-beta-1,6-N-acetyl-D-glucosamine N-deacetylase PgaB [Sporomusa sphaeroides]
MNRKVWISLLCLLGVLFSVSLPAAANDVLILCYHDVAEKPGNNIYTVTPAALRSHLDYLKENGYTPISLKEYIAASKGEDKLPAKPVMLTFDDGYQSFYTKVFPLLKEYNYPGMMAIVTSWLDYAPAELGPLLTWQQIREMESSGLITIASHSHAAHRFTITTPQGDRGPLLGNLQYKEGQYESVADYRQRVVSDFAATQTVLARELGHTAKALVWPFGAYTQLTIEEASAAGFEACFALNDGVNRPGKQALAEANRIIITNNPSKKRFAQLVNTAGKAPVKAAQLDLDIIYDPDSAEQTEENLNLAIDRLLVSGTNTVYLQAFSDESGSGNIESVYFYTTAAPVRADLFSHAVARLRAEGRFTIYAWLPTLAAQWIIDENPEAAVVAYEAKNLGWYRRATPFSPEVSDRLAAMVTDLVKYSDINGILFQDDVYLNDFEDFSPAAKQVFKTETGLELTPELLKANPELNDRWIKMKTNALTGLTVKLQAAAKEYRNNLGSARNIYPILITEPEAEEWLGQNYDQYLETYDYTVIMAYPYLEKEYEDPVGWLEELATAALRNPQNAQKTVFKLQTYDWNKNRWLSADEINRFTKALKKKGAIHIAYYPENVFSE